MKLFGYRRLSARAGGAETLVSDVVVPTTWSPYVVERTAQLTAFWQSGVVQTDPAFDALASAGGQTTPMPFWQDLQGSDEVLSDTGSLTTGKITATQDTARVGARGFVQATFLTGFDGTRAIYDAYRRGWREAGRSNVHLLISHTHWDHIQGLPYFSPLYQRGNKLAVYARKRDDKELEIRLWETLGEYMVRTGHVDGRRLFDSEQGDSQRLVPRWIFLRALGLIYFSAFYSLVFQIRGLIGPNGILPAS